MKERGLNIYQKAVKDRINLIMDIIGLEIAGFAQFKGLSTSHIYAILNGTRSLTADRIGSSLNLTGSQILNLDYVISNSTMKEVPAVKNFHNIPI